MKKNLFFVSSINIVGILLGLSYNIAFASNTASNVQSTATLASTCAIQTNNVNFGQIILPSAENGQNASTTMSVQCTKGSSYTISLSYGGVYGTGTAGVYYVFAYNTNNGHSIVTTYEEYSSTGVYMKTVTFIGAPPNTTYNTTTREYSSGSTVYAYGLLKGVTGGDTISYKITVPNNDSEVWNNGNFSYTATATGDIQSIPVKATLQTGTQGSAYPAPDSYTDTVTATISY